MTSTLTNSQACPMCGWFLGVRPQTYMVTLAPAGRNSSSRPVRVLNRRIGMLLQPSQARLELLDAGHEPLHVLLLGIGHVDPVQVAGAASDAAAILDDHAARHAHHGGVGRSEEHTS